MHNGFENTSKNSAYPPGRLAVPCPCLSVVRGRGVSAISKVGYSRHLKFHRMLTGNVTNLSRWCQQRKILSFDHDRTACVVRGRLASWAWSPAIIVPPAFLHGARKRLFPWFVTPPSAAMFCCFLKPPCCRCGCPFVHPRYCWLGCFGRPRRWCLPWECTYQSRFCWRATNRATQRDQSNWRPSLSEGQVLQRKEVDHQG